MKNPKRLTRTQKEIVSSHGLKADEGALMEETEFYYKLIHKTTKKTKITDKFMRGTKR